MRMSICICLLVAIYFIFGQSAFAGKIDDVQTQLMVDCHKEISSQQALPLVKTLFLTCTPKTKVVIDGCNVNCLKGNIGAVVGK